MEDLEITPVAWSSDEEDGGEGEWRTLSISL